MGAKQVSAAVATFLLVVLLTAAAAWCRHPQGAFCWTWSLLP